MLTAFKIDGQPFIVPQVIPAFTGLKQAAEYAKKTFGIDLTVTAKQDTSYLIEGRMTLGDRSYSDRRLTFYPDHLYANIGIVILELAAVRKEHGCIGETPFNCERDK